ncbi:hypothetical protein FQZ97_1121810 [compost metagenome]
MTRVKSEIWGRKSSPMPSTSQLPDLVLSVPSLMYWVRMEPTGSASTISVCGECSAKQRDRPVMVPELPQPNTMASNWPSIWRKISGPVPNSCAAGLSGLPNWLMK